MLEVRDGARSDLAHIAQIQAVATAELRTVYRPERRRVTASVVARKLDRDLLVATLNGELVGVVEYVLRADELFLRGLAVHAGTRRRGVAKALLDRLAARARLAELPALALTTIKETGNPAIFERLGFAAVEERAAVGFEGIDGGPVIQVRMIRHL